MKNALICLLLVVLTALLFILGSKDKPKSVAPSAYPELTQIFEQANGNPALAGAAIGFCLLDAGGKVVFERNSHTAFIPASTLKTLTTATALEKWGPDFRIRTTLHSTGQVKDRVIAGDVILRGGGDPMLSLQDLESWAIMLRNQGLLRITGRIIGDGRLLPGSLYNDFWNWGDIGNGYGSGVSGLNLEHNRFIAQFRPGTELGMKATFVGASPEVPGIEWLNEVTTGAASSGDGVVIHGGERTHLMHLRGTVPLGGQNFQISGAVPDPVLYAAHHLRLAFINAGISVDGEATTADSTNMAEVSEILFEHDSPPLIDIIESIHASSDNHETECLYRLLGLSENKQPEAVVKEYWQTRGLAFEGLRMEDGCGLARADFIRPVDLARLQHLAGSGPQGELYRGSLLADTGGNLQWKGGAMSGVRSYTGFVKAASGADFTFALMVNHFSDSKELDLLRTAILSVLRKS